MNKKIKQILLMVAVIGLAILYNTQGWGQYLSLDSIRGNREYLVDLYVQNPIKISAIYFVIYVLVTAVSLPGAAILTLAGGGIFGVLVGTVLVSFASTCGATLAFLFSRYLLRDSIQNKFGDRLKTINEGVKTEGAFYLFTLRLIPAFPFWLINLLMGLTPISVGTYFVVSQVGMFAGTIVFVNAGTQIAHITSLRGILSPSLVGSFVLIGLLPIVIKKSISIIRNRKSV